MGYVRRDNPGNNTSPKSSLENHFFETGFLETIILKTSYLNQQLETSYGTGT